MSFKSCVRHLPPVGLSVRWIIVGTTIMCYETSQSNRSPQWRNQFQDLFLARYRLPTCLQDLSRKSRHAKAPQLFCMLLWFSFSLMPPLKMKARVFWSTSSGLHKALVQPLGMVDRSPLLTRNSSEYKRPCCILSLRFGKSHKLPFANFAWKINLKKHLSLKVLPSPLLFLRRFSYACVNWILWICERFHLLWQISSNNQNKK